jgi:hypothetical protein
MEGRKKMTKMKILVCDDLKGRYEEVQNAIKEAGQADLEVIPLIEGDLTAELGSLFDCVKGCLGERKDYKATNLAFGSVDLVVLDNNLSHLDIKGTRLTAESIAGYIRAFTGAPYIISLNKNPDVDFDLRYLIGDYETRADLALNTEHLSNPALWTGKPAEAKGGFLPWYWPKLPTVAGRRLSQITFVQDHLDEPVLGSLGIPTEEAIGFLSLHARGALSPEAESDGESDKGGLPIDRVTFRDVFIAKNRSLPVKQEREYLSDVARGGNADVRHIISRVIAADIDLWFRRDVLGPQEMLVDLPHLLMRMPFLLGDRTRNIEQWNNAITEIAAPFGTEKRLYDERLAAAKVVHDIWVPSPSFRWPALKADDSLNELFFESKQEDWPDVVFCEDRSIFLDRSLNEKNAAPSEFSAEFEGSWGRRYVARLGRYRYAPRSRFAI